MHAGAAARLQELQTQLEQARVQQQRMQDGFSADLAKARETVEAADRRASTAEKRALMEVEQERQARAKADKHADSGSSSTVAAHSLESGSQLAQLFARCLTHGITIWRIAVVQQRFRPQTSGVEGFDCEVEPAGVSLGRWQWSSAHVKLLVASFMQPTAVYRFCANAL